MTPPTLTTTLPVHQHSGRSPRQRYQLWHKWAQLFGQSSLPYQPVVDHLSTQGIPYTQDYGDTVGEEKSSNIFRVAYGNIDGFSTVSHTNPKAIQLHH
jgi:hypothetical protein